MAPDVGILRKIITGYRYRRPRQHDEKGNIIDACRWRHRPVVPTNIAAHTLFRRLDEEPWSTVTVVDVMRKHVH